MRATPAGKARRHPRLRDLEQWGELLFEKFLRLIDVQWLRPAPA